MKGLLRITGGLLLAFGLVGAGWLARSAGPRGASADTPFAWNERNARHLLNRAGFGTTPAELERALARRPEDVVEELLTGGRPAKPFEIASTADLRRLHRDAPPLAVEHRMRISNQAQLRDYALWWIDAMLAGVDPLRDRMTLFWHGFFTTSVRTVRHSGMIATQHRFLRENALGSYADLLHGIARDPAMLAYLDADASRAGAPNENFARELLELYSLGEGNYDETDVKETARALTGAGYDEEGAYRFGADRHDGGVKTILGATGSFRPEDVAGLILAREACARWVAGSVIEFLEGVPPAPERLERYARLLRAERWELAPFLRDLFLDPEFYRDEVVGTRVRSPIDLLVGTVRTAQLPVTVFSVRVASSELGEELFAPPSVKGWPRGQTWITTSSLIDRANLCGVLLGTVDTEEMHAAVAPAADEGGSRMDRLSPTELCRKPATGRKVALAKRLAEWSAHLARHDPPDFPPLAQARSAGVESDAEAVRFLLRRALAIEPPRDLAERVERGIAAGRAERGLPPRAWIDQEGAEEVVRRALHRILSSPAAQLH